MGWKGSLFLIGTLFVTLVAGYAIGVAGMAKARAREWERIHRHKHA